MISRKPALQLLIILSILLLLPIIFHLRVEAAVDSTAAYLPLVMNNYDPRWQWGDNYPITLEPHPYNLPVSVIDQQGQFHIFWDTLTTGQRYIFHAILTPAGWSTPAPVANSQGNSTILYPPIVGSDGRIHIVWRTYLGTAVQYPYRLLYANFDGNSWSPVEEVYQDGIEIDGILRLDALGDPHVTIVETALGSTIVHTRRTSSGWTSPENIDPNHVVFVIWPDMNGGVHMYGYNYNLLHGFQLHYSYWQDGAFMIYDRQAPGEFSGRETQMDGATILHTFWAGQVPAPGGTVNGLSYQCLDSSLNWGPTKILSGENEIGGAVQKAWDQDKQVGLAWKETASGNVLIQVWSGCQPASEGHPIPLPAGEDWEISTIALRNNTFKACALAKVAYQYNYSAVCTVIE